ERCDRPGVGLAPQLVDAGPDVRQRRSDEVALAARLDDRNRGAAVSPVETSDACIASSERLRCGQGHLGPATAITEIIQIRVQLDDADAEHRDRSGGDPDTDTA